MYKAAVMGDKDSICGFAALGLDTVPVEDPKTAAETLRRMAADQYAVIFVTEALAAQISEEIDRYRDRMMPAIILIPGITGNTGQGMADVRKSVERAVGSDIIS